MKAVGFVVSGVHPLTVRMVHERYEARLKAIETAKAAGQRTPPPLKPPGERRMRRQTLFGPTVVRGAALEAARLAQHTGWVDVQITERQ